MINRMASFVVFAGLCLTLFASSGRAADDLVTFDRAKIGEAKQSCGVRVIAKLDKLALGLLPSGQLHILKKGINNMLTQSDANLFTYIWLGIYFTACAIFFSIAIWIITRGGKDVSEILNKAKGKK